jgi:hypothetical protein
MKLSKLRRLIREIVIREADKAGQQQLKPGQYWYIEVSYPASWWYDDLKLSKRIENAIYAAANTVGLYVSNTGFHGRSRYFGFTTRVDERAKKFMSLARQIFGVKVNMKLMD